MFLPKGALVIVMTKALLGRNMSTFLCVFMPADIGSRQHLGRKEEVGPVVFLTVMSLSSAPRIPPDKRIFTTRHTPSCVFQEVDER